MEQNVVTAAPLDDAEKIAKLYRRLVLLVGAYLLLSVFVQVAPRMAASSMVMVGVLALVALLLLIAALAAIAVTAYKLMRYLGGGSPILWAIAMFLPCINIIGLLAISSKAQTWCQQYGIKVGFLGPTPESIEEVRRRTVTSQFD